MRRVKLSVLFVTVLAVLLALGIVSYNYVTHSLNESRPIVNKGTCIVYEIVPSGSLLGIPSSIMDSRTAEILNSLNVTTTDLRDLVTTYPFYIQFYRSYYDLVLDHSKGVLDWNKMCEVVAKRAFIILRVTDMNKTYAHVSITLSLTDGYARCSYSYGTLPTINGHWIKANKFYVARFKSLNMTREVLINLNTFEVRDTSNTYGEWVFWLNRRDLSQKYTLLLYHIDDMAEVAHYSSSVVASGVAKLLILNLTREAPSGYNLNGKVISKDQQIYTDNVIVPSEVIMLNITRDDAGYFLNLLRKNNCKCKWRPFPLPVQYVEESRKLIINKDVLPEIIDLSSKPWIYIANLTRYSHKITLRLPNGEERTILAYDVLPGIRYGNKYYVALICNDGEVSYTKSGLLLYLKLNGGNAGLLYDKLPTVIAHAFAITPMSHIDREVLVITLVNITSK